MSAKFVPYNILSYTSLSPQSCNEEINVPLGHVCMTDNAIELLNKNIDKLGEDVDEEDIVYKSSHENQPTDGSENAKIVLKLINKLEVNTEYEVLTHPDVINILGVKGVEEEKKRFKPKGPRNIICGTTGDSMYEVLLQWSNIFKFFIPLKPEVYSSNDKENIITVKKINGIFDSNANIRVVAGISTISTVKDGGWHAVAILVDKRTKPWTIEFFDSGGEIPSVHYIRLMEDLKKSFDEESITVAVTGRLIHQVTSTECGMHCLIYVRRRLEGIPYTVFARVKIPDTFASDFRKYIFSS